MEFFISSLFLKFYSFVFFILLFLFSLFLKFKPIDFFV